MEFLVSIVLFYLSCYLIYLLLLLDFDIIYNYATFGWFKKPIPRIIIENNNTIHSNFE